MKKMIVYLALHALCVLFINPTLAQSKNESGTVKNQSALLVSSASVTAKASTIRGKVVDEKGEPLEGVSVLVKGSVIGTKTDNNGIFTIEAPGNPTLIVSYIGFETMEVAVNNRINVVLELILKPSIIQSDEVVVVGYGSQKKINVTGAISSVRGDALVKSPTGSVTNSLAGRVTGVTTVQAGGMPGRDEPQIFVRGVGSLTTGSSAPLMLVDGVERPLTQLDPNEIESISILKDASATAVYGIRGANGVILVTTKRGVAGPPKISFSTSYGFQIPLNLPETADSYTYVTKYNEVQRSDNPNGPVAFSPFVVEAFRTGKYPDVFFSTDWTDILVKKSAPQKQSNINMSGGTNVLKYFVSLGYFDQSGLINSFNIPDFYQYKRFNYRANVDLDATKSTKFSLTIGGRNETRGRTDDPNNLFWWVWGATVPWSGKILPDGRNVVAGSFYKPNNVGSPILPRNSSALPYNNAWYKDVTNVINLDIQLTQKLDFITKGLTWRIKGSNNSRVNLSKVRTASQISYDPMFKTDVDPTAIGDSTVVYRTSGEEGVLNYVEGSGKGRDWYVESALNYNGNFGDHRVTGLLLYNVSRWFYPGGEYNDLPLGYVGLAARTTYAYGNKYMVDLNLGYNGSENFAPGKRFGFFPAVSLAWVASEENFIKNATGSVLTNLKFRMSYGLVGNDRQGTNRFLYRPTAYNATSGGAAGSGYNFGTNVPQSVLLASEGRLGNPDVTWEKAAKQDYGIDLRLFNKLSLTVDYFHEIRNNILSTRNSVPSIFFITLPVVNLGRVQNSGYEVEVKWNDRIGNADYYLGGNITFNKNKILFMDEIEQPYDYLMRTGHRVGQPWGYLSDGFWTQKDIDRIGEFPNPNFSPKPGDLRYKDINNDKVIDNFDQVAIGFPSYPEIIYGLNGGISFKGFDLSMLWQGATHVSKLIGTQNKIPFGDNGGRALMMHLIKNSWTPETANTAIYPRMTFANRSNNYNRTSDVWLQDASYIRLKNAEIGYTFSPTILKRLGMSSMRVYGNGYNLLTFTKIEKSIDPEAPGGDPNYPLIQVFNFGVNVNF
jgi:TonB-linked SusC/RagA family outer membrane protein